MSASGHSNAGHEETMNKAKAMLKAVEIAERGF
jgi:hypothetical protein